MNPIIDSITGCPYNMICNSLPDSVDKGAATAVFEEIIRESLQSVERSDDPVLINAAGIPGAGKSTWCLDFMESHPDYLYITFDGIMEDARLPYRNSADKDQQQAFEEWELPARIAGYELLSRAVDERNNILLEHSSSIPEHLELFERIMDNGYAVHLIYLPVSPGEAGRRIAQRTGRHLPGEYIRRRHEMLTELLPRYRQLCTSFKEIGI